MIMQNVADWHWIYVFQIPTVVGIGCRWLYFYLDFAPLRLLPADYLGTINLLTYKVQFCKCMYTLVPLKQV